MVLLVAVAALIVCVLFVDRPLALWVHERGIDQSPFLRWITLVPPVVQAWSPLAIALLLVRRAWGPFRPWERAIFAAAVAIIVAEQVTESLRPAFGRSWPKTWIDNNPALIPGGVYAFHPFDASVADGDCPSGHSARTLSVVAVAWMAWPSWPARVIGAVTAILVVVALVGMDYHFLGDCVLGGTLGALVGVAAAEVAGVGSMRAGASARPERPRDASTGCGCHDARCHAPTPAGRG